MTLTTRLGLVFSMLFVLAGCTVQTKGAEATKGGTSAPPSESASSETGPSESGEEASPSETPASGGHVPAELVGTWNHSGGGASIVYTFADDGTYHESSGMSLGGSCSATSVWDVDGIVSFGDGTVTFERQSGTLTTETCSSTTEKPVAPETKTKSWILDGGILYTWDADCADYLTCGVAFEPQ